MNETLRISSQICTAVDESELVDGDIVLSEDQAAGLSVAFEGPEGSEEERY